MAAFFEIVLRVDMGGSFDGFPRFWPLGRPYLATGLGKSG
jgi:hypothetical protein